MAYAATTTPVTNPAVQPPRGGGREAALQARIAELETELRARDDFLAFAAHELRNPMTPISARLELLLAKARRTPAGAPDGLVQGLERLERLVDAYMRRATVLLEMSRISCGSLSLQPAELDISALIRQVAADMSPLAERAGCQVRLAVEDGVTALGDAMAIEQILENLLSNAVRYGCARSIDISFADAEGMARLSVRDRGIGISEADQVQIFERFHTLSRTSPKGGFGVGLWITRQLVRAMGGEIAVASQPGIGSTFSAKWPLSRRSDGDAR